MAACEEGISSHGEMNSVENCEVEGNPAPEFSDKCTTGTTYADKALDLIYEVRKFACIWDHRNSEWKDTPKKKVLCKHLAAKLNYKDGKTVYKVTSRSVSVGLQNGSVPISTGYEILNLILVFTSLVY